MIRVMVYSNPVHKHTHTHTFAESFHTEISYAVASCASKIKIKTNKKTTKGIKASSGKVRTLMCSTIFTKAS